MRLMLCCLVLGILLPLAGAEDLHEEIEARIRRWQSQSAQYTESPNTRGSGPSLTAIYANDRTGLGTDPLVEEFLKRGYYLLDALKTRRNMAPLTETETAAFRDAVRLSKITFVDHELVDNTGKRVSAVTDPDAQNPNLRNIQVYRKDWEEGARLGADLTKIVFHEYLRAIGKFDDNYIVSSGLTVSERDFKKTFVATAGCVSGKIGPAQLSFNLPIDSAYSRAVVYVNGLALYDQTSFRTAQTTPLCSAKAYRFDVRIYDYTQTFYLYGGDNLIVKAPSGEEFYNR